MYKQLKNIYFINILLHDAVWIVLLVQLTRHHCRLCNMLKASRISFSISLFVFNEFSRVFARLCILYYLYFIEILVYEHYAHKHMESDERRRTPRWKLLIIYISFRNVIPIEMCLYIGKKYNFKSFS